MQLALVSQKWFSVWDTSKSDRKKVYNFDEPIATFVETTDILLVLKVKLTMPCLK